MHAKPRPNPSKNKAELGVVDQYRDRVGFPLEREPMTKALIASLR